LGAYRAGEPLPGFSFELPVSLAVAYSGSELAHLVPESLALYYWHGAGWQQAATTCDPGTGAIQGPENAVSTPVCRPGHFAVFGQAWHKLFLPAVLR
jgi:hypothetical protein